MNLQRVALLQLIRPEVTSSEPEQPDDDAEQACSAHGLHELTQHNVACNGLVPMNERGAGTQVERLREEVKGDGCGMEGVCGEEKSRCEKEKYDPEKPLVQHAVTSLLFTFRKSEALSHHHEEKCSSQSQTSENTDISVIWANRNMISL